MAFWKKKEPEKANGSVDRYDAILDKQSADDLIAAHYPGGKAAFDEMWKSTPGRAVARMCDALFAKGHRGGTHEVFLLEYWPKLSVKDQVKVVLDEARQIEIYEKKMIANGLDPDAAIREWLEEGDRIKEALMKRPQN